jgi:hypothetical protein
MTMSFLPKISPRDTQARRVAIDRELIRREAEKGSKLFGPIPKGHQRQFFCLDAHSWIWYEEWKEAGHLQRVTTRYEVRPDGVLKTQNGSAYQRLSDQEAINFYKAAKLYIKKNKAHYQQAYGV